MEILLAFALGFFFGSLYILVREKKRKIRILENSIKEIKREHNPEENSWTWYIK